MSEERIRELTKGMLRKKPTTAWNSSTKVLSGNRMNPIMATLKPILILERSGC